MSTQTERIDEMRERINRLEAKAQEAGSQTKESMKSRADALRQQEAAAREALRRRTDAADEKVRQLKAQIDATENALAAELAEDKQEFTTAMEGYLDRVKELSHGLSEKTNTMAGAARADAESAIADVRRSRDALAERVAEVRQESGEKWRERKQRIAASAAELDRKVDDALKKIK